MPVLEPLDYKEKAALYAKRYCYCNILIVVVVVVVGGGGFLVDRSPEVISRAEGVGSPKC